MRERGPIDGSIDPIIDKYIIDLVVLTLTNLDRIQVLPLLVACRIRSIETIDPHSRECAALFADAHRAGIRLARRRY